jgi:hypothetical protein
MAVQQRLGLLSDRRLGGSRCHRPCAGLAWSALVFELSSTLYL